MKQLLKIFKWRDIPHFAVMALAFLPGKLWKLFRPNIWVVTEYADLARDNGYWIYKYLRENKPEISAYYPIKKTSPDYEKIRALGNAVEFGSFRHYMLYWAANRYLGTTKWHGFPDERTGIFFQRRNLTGFKYIFLNHGVARGVSHIVNAQRTNYDMVVAISEAEKEIMVKYNHQKPENVYALGFCRHDNLNDSLLENRTILFMPTWRNYLDIWYEKDERKRRENRAKFLKSEYYRRCQELLENPRLLAFLEENDMKLYFYLHNFAQGYADDFHAASPRVIVAKKDEYDLQELLKRAAFLITDYSSVIFDFAYMKKPCAYYQFDRRVFEKNQYAQSEDYTYERDGFGPVYESFEELFAGLKKSWERRFEMEELYRQRVEAYFPYFDDKHCARTVRAIQRHKHQ